MMHPKQLLVLIFSLVVLVLPSIVLVLFCLAIFGVLAFLLLLVLLLVTRIAQLIRGREVYEKLTQFKHVIRYWLFYSAVYIQLGSWLFFPIAKYVPLVKQVMLLELPLTKWVVIVSIICGLCIFNGLLYKAAHQVIAKFMDGGSSLTAGQAFSEIIDCLFFWWATYEVMKRVPSFQQHEILGLPTRKWIKVSVLVVIGCNLIILFTLSIVLLLRKIYQCLLLQGRASNTLTFWQEHLRYVVYFLNGMAVSISFIMSSLLLVLTWVLYVGSHLDMKSANARDMWEYGKRTFISLLICSFLWLIKTAVLLAWEAHSVYDALQDRIISASEQLSFLSIIGSTVHDIFQIQQYFRPKKEFQQSWVPQSSEERKEFSFGLYVEPQNPEKVRKKIQKDLLQLQKLANPSMDDIQQATQYFLKAKKPLMRDTYISDILQGFDAINDNRKLLEKLFFEKVTNLKSSHVDNEENSTQNPRGSHENIEDGQEQSVTESSNRISRRFHQDAEIIQVEEEDAAQNSIFDPREISVEAETKENELEQQQAETSSSRKSRGETQQNPSRSSHQDCSDVWDRFLEKLRQINSNKETDIIHLSDLQTWAERARSECMNLANTLSNAKEVANCLNHIISWLLTGAVLLMWLLFTRLATTKVLVLIASPLLAATFIFGDTCRRLFEGIFFVLVVHHINVGELCFIDDKMVEVRSIGIWRTTFTKVDNFGSTPEVLIYSTSELTNKAIINHKTTFDWSDRAEFKLTNLKKISSKLKHELTNFVEDRLKKEKCSFLANILNLTFSAEEDSITLIIRLEYNAGNIQGWTYSECLRRKDELKGDFHVYMQQLISEFKAAILFQAEQAKLTAEQARNEFSHSEIEEFWT